jgi:hypothetical protein
MDVQHSTGSFLRPLSYLSIRAKLNWKSHVQEYLLVFTHICNDSLTIPAPSYCLEEKRG